MASSAEGPLAAAAVALVPGIVTAESRRRSRGAKQPSETTIDVASARRVRGSARVVGIGDWSARQASNLEGPLGDAKEGRTTTQGRGVPRCEFGKTEVTACKPHDFPDE